MNSLLLICLFVVPFISAYERFEGYKLIQVIPATNQQMEVVKSIESMFGIEIDFWKISRQFGQKIDFMVDGKHAEQIVEVFQSKKMNYKIILDDMSKLIDRSMNELARSPQQSFIGDDPSQFRLDVYHSHANINNYLHAVANSYPNFVSLSSLGKSHENRDMLYLKIGKASSQPKNALWIDAGIHAREWVAPATALYTISQLVNGYTTIYKTLLDSIDIYIAPSINPDGYEYSRNENRLWRKTRSGPRFGCYGVDPNRNWAFHWAESGTSSNPCSEIYRGPSAFSEKECATVKRFLDANAGEIKGYLTLHSYGEDWIYPWGYATHTYPPDVAQLRSLGLQSAAAINQVRGTRYTVDNSADDLYAAAGASDDYSKSIGIKWVYTVELRPGDGDEDNDHSYGFDLPAQFIMPTASEAFPGLMVVANRIMTGPN